MITLGLIILSSFGLTVKLFRLKEDNQDDTDRNEVKMKLKEFKKLNLYRYQITALENDIRAAQAQAEKSTASWNPTPHGTGNVKARENAILRLIELKAQLEQVTAEREKLLDTYNRIPDPFAKEVIKIRYDIEHDGKHLLSWVKIAFIIGGGNTADGLRMYCTRAVKDL